MLFVRPAEQLREGHRIVVGVRGLVDSTGSPIEPTPAFAAYRDLVRTADPNLEDRRPAFERTFADLDAIGIGRGDLQFAWDFTIASTEALSGRLLHMRDDAFARLDGHAPAFTVTYDEPSTREGVEREIRGTYEVPMLVSIPLGRLVLLPGERFHDGRISLYIAARDEMGRTSRVNKHVCPVRIVNSEILVAMGRNAACGVRMLMRPGKQRVAVTVRDELSLVDSTVALEVEIPSPEPSLAAASGPAEGAL